MTACGVCGRAEPHPGHGGVPACVIDPDEFLIENPNMIVAFQAYNWTLRGITWSCVIYDRTDVEQANQEPLAAGKAETMQKAFELAWAGLPEVEEEPGELMAP